MRAGPQLGVAKAARAPPCTLPILGRRFLQLNISLQKVIFSALWQSKTSVFLKIF